jgi:hypothetical protein
MSVFLVQFPAFDLSMKSLEDIIGASPEEVQIGRKIGEAASWEVVRARSDDGITRVCQPSPSARK